jgi:hypothetical protein
MKIENDSQQLFYEVQHFRQSWIWIVVLFIVVFVWYAFIKQVVLGTPIQENPTSDKLMIALWVLFGLILPSFCLFARLITIVREDGIYLLYLPLKRKYTRIAPVELNQQAVRRYSALFEYGGWGARKNSRGRAFIIRGKYGVQLMLEDGQLVLIGSQRSDELLQVIQTLQEKQKKEPAKDSGKTVSPEETMV